MASLQSITVTIRAQRYPDFVLSQEFTDEVRRALGISAFSINPDGTVGSSPLKALGFPKGTFEMGE